MDVVVIGAGLYVSGKGTTGYGTILPALFEWKRISENIGKFYFVSTSVESSKELKEKASHLVLKTGVELEVHSYPESGNKDYFAYRKVISNLKKPACAIIAVPDHLHHQIA